MSIQQLETVHSIIKQRPHFTSTMAMRRDAWEGLAARFPTPPDIKQTPTHLDSVPALWIDPPDAASDKVILFFHGGGFVLGSSQSHKEVLSRLARSAGVRGVAIDQRLAPEHPFPQGLEDCVIAYEWLLKQGFAASKICFAGDSAGANFVITAMLLARQQGLPLPACGLCWSGWYDLTNSSESFETNVKKDVFVPPGFAGPAAKLYLASADPKNPLASPLFGDLKNFPPLLIQVGDVEVGLDDSRRLHDAAKTAGVDSTLEVWPDMCHIWQFFGQILDEGQEATVRSGEFVRHQLGRVVE